MKIAVPKDMIEHPENYPPLEWSHNLWKLPAPQNLLDYVAGKPVPLVEIELEELERMFANVKETV